MQIPRRLKADLALAFVTLTWGATFVVVKEALADASPLTFVLLRFTLAFAILAVAFRRRLRRSSRGLLRAELIIAGLIIGGLLYAGFAFQTAGLKLTTPTKSAFLTAMSVVLVPLLQVAIFRERLRGAVLGGVAAAVVGLYFLTMPPGAIRLETGDLLTLACALAFAGHIVALGRYAPRFDVATLAVLQVGAAMLFAALAMPLFDATGVERIFAVPTPRLAVALLVTAGLATAAAFSIQTWAQRITSPTHAAILFTLEPVFAALTSLLVLNERLGGRELLGAGLILAGVLVAELRAVPAPETPGVPAPPASPDADSR